MTMFEAILLTVATAATPLLLAAKAKGAGVLTGRDLAVYQAADAFELFTGLQPSVTVIGNAFDAVMASRYPAA